MKMWPNNWPQFILNNDGRGNTRPTNQTNGTDQRVYMRRRESWPIKKSKRSQKIQRKREREWQLLHRQRPGLLFHNQVIQFFL